MVQAKALVTPPPIRDAVIQRASSDSEADDEDSDDERSGINRLRRTNARGRKGHRQRGGRRWRDHPYQRHEQTAKRWYDAGRNLDTEYVKTGFGEVTISRGRAAAAGPMTNTNEKNYPGTKLGTKYMHIRAALNTGKARLAKAILTYLRKGINPTPGKFTATQIRAAAAIIGITHISEEARFPGAAKLARSLLKKIADGEMTFQEAFKEEWFPMVGSATSLQAMVDSGDAGKLDSVLREMSDSSDDEESLPRGSISEGGKRVSTRLKSKEAAVTRMESERGVSPTTCRNCGHINYENEKTCESCSGPL